MANKKVMKMPYSSLLAKRNNRSKHYLMISELIDNSIGSWQQNKMNSKLDIYITFDEKDKKISCWDNAFGMSPDELMNSVELNIEKRGNVINMFGVGMKNAAFWYGSDLLIHTFDNKNKSATEVIVSKVHDLKTPVEWELSRTSKRKTQGTTIEIRSVYSDRFVTSSEFDELVTILGIKYRKYIRNEVSLKLTWINKKGNEITKDIDPFDVKAQVIPSNLVDSFVQSLTKSTKSRGELVLDGLYENMIVKAKAGEELRFTKSITWRDKEITFVVGITNQPETGSDTKNFKQSYGITTYQKSRAINIAGINPLAFGSPGAKSSSAAFDYTRTNIKRVHAFVELGDIFRPDNNKSEFNFGQHREGFYKLLSHIGKDVIEVANAVHEIMPSTKKAKAGNTRTSKKKIQSVLDTKTSDNWKWDVNSRGTNLTIKNKGIEPINVKIIEEDSRDFFIQTKHNPEESLITIWYNINHPIWKPISTEITSIDFKDVLYKLVAIIGISKVSVENEMFKEIWDIDTNDFLEVINIISKRGIKF